MLLWYVNKNEIYEPKEDKLMKVEVTSRRNGFGINELTGADLEFGELVLMDLVALKLENGLEMVVGSAQSLGCYDERFSDVEELLRTYSSQGGSMENVVLGVDNILAKCYWVYDRSDWDDSEKEYGDMLTFMKDLGKQRVVEY